MNDKHFIVPMLPSNVTDRESFIRFTELLDEDLKLNPQKWANITLSDFLKAIAAYTSDIQGYYDNIDQPINADIPSWRVFADILKGASIYE